MKAIVIALALAFGLTACEKTQTAPSARKPDSKQWEAAQNPFVAPGWKSGDEASWEAQLRKRASRQNEYASARARE
ncbi:MAG TPA: hypothetical protein VLW55_12740 [Burkholderiaceae bacterium]|nr:hypothetical protein [Burkholderiaceae bacterium]